MARCLLIESQLPKELWTYAVSVAAYTRSRCFSPRTGKTPYEMLTGKKPDVSRMSVFGTICYAYVQNKKKLDARSEMGIFVGYDRESPAYLVYFKQSGIIKKVRCVRFTNRFDVNTDNTDTNVDDCDDFQRKSYDDSAVDARVDTHVDQGQAEAAVENAPNADQNNVNVETEVQNETSSENDRRYPRRNTNKPKRLNDYVLEDNSVNVTMHYCYRMHDVPLTYDDALSCLEAENWKHAMSDEMNSLMDNDTFELSHLPDGRNVIGGRWVYAVKLGPNDEELFKARYVAKGYSQVRDVDYCETFSPTARITSIRMLMQLAVQQNLIVHQMDVKTAYLNAPIDCELYIEQPPGFVKTDETGKPLVLKLKRSLYGLKKVAEIGTTCYMNI